ncbi:MAG TPA: GlxA family transcriptional regulator [Acidimicrobiales bacterium]
MPASPPRRVVIIIFDGIQSLDLTGPLEVFHSAGRYAREVTTPVSAAGSTPNADPGYEVVTASPGAAPLTTSSGLRVMADLALSEVEGPIDTLVVAGGDGVHTILADPGRAATLASHLRRLAPASRRVASVCSGAFLLAEAGLLDGRRATTHWSRCAQLAQRYPAVTVEPDPIFTRDGDMFTSAGVTAGMDLALALVEDDLGREAALTVARWLVLFLHRPGNQAQFSAQLSVQLADRHEVRSLQQTIVEHPGADCSVEALARRVGMSPRHLARVFSDEVGTTPARYVEQVRLEAARRRLEESADAVEVVAATCGFGSTETMRRSFLRSLGVPPAEYRRRFRTAVA